MMRRARAAEKKPFLHHRRKPTALWLGLMAGLALIGAGTLVFALERVGSAEGYAPEQPIAFSHQLHAGQYQVPCLYCHSGAASSRHAGIPASGLCMGCHRELQVQSRQIAKLEESVAQGRSLAWIKVHNLPDFVYFNHSQHVGAELACQECHGAVETMTRLRQVAPLTMGWCLECHRRREITEFSPAPAVAERPASPIGGLDCSKCHY